jgi:tRNA(Arg) A34 adenosine deaminase TadA
MDPTSAWTGLSSTWQLAIDQAWESWANGSAGIGAVLVDEAGSVIATGRNRTTERSTAHLSGTMMAHAEMDVLSQVPFDTRLTGALYTTFEPCLMCAATIAFYRVPAVHFAAADPYFEGLHDWLGTSQFTVDRTPERVRLGGPLGTFCHLLHLTWLIAYPAPVYVIDTHRFLSAAVFTCARGLADQGRLRDLSDRGGAVLEAITELWPELVALDE